METFDNQSALNERVKEPVIHISLNPSPQDELTEGQLASLAAEFMEKFGYGRQPYLVYLHTDIDRKHLHIVSHRVRNDGQKIDYYREAHRAMAICREMEQKYGLHPPGKSDTRQEIAALRKVDYPAGDVKEQVKRTARTLIERYNVRSLPELNTLLELYNIRIDEVKGVQNGEASVRGIERCRAAGRYAFQVEQARRDVRLKVAGKAVCPEYRETEGEARSIGTDPADHRPGQSQLHI